MSKLSTLRRIKKHFDWEGYIEDNYVYKRAHGAHGEELRINCPNCGDRKYKCYINVEYGLFHCFKCDFSMKDGNKDLFDFVAITEGISRGASITKLLISHRDLAPTEEEFFSSLEDTEPQDPLPKGIRVLDSLPSDFAPVEAVAGDRYWEYVKDRGFTEEDLSVTNLHYTPSSSRPIYNEQGKYKGDIRSRIVFPIYYEGKLASWLARSTGSDCPGPKYLNCPDTELSKTLWPYSLPYSHEAVLVEGVIDALSVRRVKGVSAYATFGKSISKGQLDVLRKWGIMSVVLWYDKKDALDQMISMVETLKMRFHQVFVLDLSEWPDDKDTGDFLRFKSGPAIIEETLNKRINVYDELEYARWKRTF